MSQLQDNLLEIKRQKDLYLLPENIKKDLEILGVVGTFDVGSVEGIKQFSSIQEMENSTGNVEGDLAIIYTSTQSNLTEATQTQFITFPETVVLPSAITDYVEVGLQSLDTSIMFDCMGSLDSSRFNLDMYIESGSGNWINYRIQYSSSDGQNYTRTTFENQGTVLENPVDMTTIVQFGNRYGEAEWNDAIGYFMIVGISLYQGIYTYVDNNWKIAKTGLTATKDNVIDTVFEGSNGVEEGILSQSTNLSLDQIKYRVEVFDNLSYLNLSENITNLYSAFSHRKDLITIPNINTSNVTNMETMFYNCPNLITVSNINMSKVFGAYGMFMDCINLISIPNFNMEHITNTMQMFYNCYSLVSIPNFNMINVKYATSMFLNCTNLVSIPFTSTANIISMQGMFRQCTNLIDVPQLDTSSVKTMQGMFINCNNLSNNSYANITNMLPFAKQLENQYVSDIGLNIENFTLEQKQILGNKGYYDALSYVINTANLSTSWNILYS